MTIVPGLITTGQGLIDPEGAGGPAQATGRAGESVPASDVPRPKCESSLLSALTESNAFLVPSMKRRPFEAAG